MQTEPSRTRAPSPKQRRLAKIDLENRQKAAPSPMKDLLIETGYSELTAKTPKTITDTPGYKQALRELGLTEELITSSLVDDIKAKPKLRIQELKLGADILGMVKREDDSPPPSGNTYNFLFSAETQAEIKEIEDKIKIRLTQKHEPYKEN